MPNGTLIGLGLLAIAVVMAYVGFPDKHGTSPRFLVRSGMVLIYPAFILVFVATGAAELIAKITNP
ncbi:hypothetical protein BH11PSE4_BH11PSE4_02720 [soil metagenome]